MIIDTNGCVRLESFINVVNFAKTVSQSYHDTVILHSILKFYFTPNDRPPNSFLHKRYSLMYPMA